jgi:very-short-patch-repair endonuclease
MPDSEQIQARGEPESAQSGLVRLANLAARQFGVVSLAQLHELGFSRGDIRGLVTRGQLHPLYRAVFAAGHPRVSVQGRQLAALLSCGPTSFLSHRTAAAVWGLRPLNPFRIEVTVPAAHVPVRPGLLVHRTAQAPNPDEVTRRVGLRVSTVARLLLELAPSETTKELDRLITEGVRKQVLDLPKLEVALERHQRRQGIGKLKQALEAYRPRPDRKSNLERAFDALIRDTGIPEPLRNVHVGGWELDCYWPEYRLAVELDGRPYHLTVKDQEKDKYKDAKLLLLGIRVMRITEFRLTTAPAEVLSDVRALTTQCAATFSATAAPKHATAPTRRR